MLETLRTLSGGKGQSSAATELQELIATAREERAALSEMLTQVSLRSANLTHISKSLAETEERAARATECAEAVAQRLADLDNRTRVIEEIDGRMKRFQAQVQQAQEDVQQIVGPGGELEKHRTAVQEVASQALEAHTHVEALKQERAVLDDVRIQFAQTRNDMQEAIQKVAGIAADIESVRTTASQLIEDSARIQTSSKDADGHSQAAMHAVAQIEKKLESLSAAQELAKNTEERLASLSALAEHVSHKVKALDGQKRMVERAVVETNRLNEMVWAMDAQIQKLNDGNAQIAATEQMLGRLEKLAQEVALQVESATKAKEAFRHEVGQFEKRTSAVTDTVRSQFERWSIEKKEIEVYHERVRELQVAVERTEAHVHAAEAQNASLAGFAERAEAVAKRSGELSGEFEAVLQKEFALESLRERLATVDEMVARTDAQCERLEASRKDLEALGVEVAECRKIHAEVVQLRGTLASERATFEAFAERVTRFSSTTPELDSKIDAVLTNAGRVEDGIRTMARADQLVQELDAKLTQVGARMQFIERVEERANALNALSVDVDRRMQDQLTRRAELECVKVQCDGVSSSILDAEQKLGAVSSSQTKVLQLAAELARLEDGVANALSRMKQLERDEASVRDTERRLQQFVDTDQLIARQTEDRLQQLQKLNEELDRAATVKNELVQELSTVRADQRETLAQVEASAEQLTRVEAAMRQLDERRAQFASGEQAIADVGRRIDHLAELAADARSQVETVVGQQEIVAAVKREVELIHQLAARSREDLQEVADHRGEVTTLKATVEGLIALMAETDEKVALIEMRKRRIDEVETKSTMIANLLDDVRVSLEALGEQKALIDHVAEKMAGADFALQEAKNTLRSLNQERERAERIEQSIKKLRARTEPRQEAATARA
jgi:chromosome segregation ATPase